MSRRPSPSLVVSIIALVFAAAGTSIAAVNFAKNAGAVDGKSAVGAASSAKRAAGKLVATASSGSLKGKIPARFLEIPAAKGFVAGNKQTFSTGVDVIDNSSTSPFGIGGAEGVGLLSGTCTDQNNNAGKEDARVTLTVANTSGQTANYVHSSGNGAPSVSTIAPSSQATFAVNNSNTFQVYVHVNGQHFVFNGAFHQAGNAASSLCAVYGYGLVL